MDMSINPYSYIDRRPITDVDVQSYIPHHTHRFTHVTHTTIHMTCTQDVHTITHIHIHYHMCIHMHTIRNM
jgi:hypothetical protein